MDWKLVDDKGNLIQMVNCEYDAIDIGRMLYDAKVIYLDFDTKMAFIKEYDNREDEISYVE